MQVMTHDKKKISDNFSFCYLVPIFIFLTTSKQQEECSQSCNSQNASQPRSSTQQLHFKQPLNLEYKKDQYKADQHWLPRWALAKKQ
jgi:hypothetical protein